MSQNDLNFLCWNVRGLNCPARRETVLRLIQVVQPSIVCLQETKVEVIDTLLGMQFLGPRLNNFDYLPAEGVRGGVLIAWDEDLIEACDSTMHEFSLSLQITMKNSNISFTLTSVYGPADDALKAQFMDRTSYRR